MTKLYAKIKGVCTVSLFDFLKTWQVYLGVSEELAFKDFSIFSSGNHLVHRSGMILVKFFFIVVSEKIGLYDSSESSARQRIHMINQALFSSKGRSKKLKCRLLQFLFGSLRIRDYLGEGVHGKGEHFHVFPQFLPRGTTFVTSYLLP